MHVDDPAALCQDVTTSSGRHDILNIKGRHEYTNICLHHSELFTPKLGICVDLFSLLFQKTATTKTKQRERERGGGGGGTGFTRWNLGKAVNSFTLTIKNNKMLNIIQQRHGFCAEHNLFVHNYCLFVQNNSFLTPSQPQKSY